MAHIMTTLGGKPIHLNDGEEIIWQGRPVQGLLRNPAHIFFGLVLAALGVWLTFGVSDVAGIVLGFILLVSGLYLLFFAAIVEKNRRAATFYALTNQRVLLAYSLRVLAYPVLQTARIKLKKGRYDTVILTVEQPPGMPSSGRPRSLGFGHLENGDEVYTLLKKIRQEA